MDSKVNLTLRLEVAFKQDGNQWLAWCQPLDVLSQGSSRQKAESSLREAILLWFESCIQRGVLEAALHEVGFHRVKPNEAASKVPKNANVVELRPTKPPKTDFTPRNLLKNPKGV